MDRTYFSTLGNQINVSVSLNSISTADRAQMAQAILRELVLPQAINGKDVVDPKLNAALETIWTALNKIAYNK